MSNGYFGSDRHLKDLCTDDNGRIADALARDIGLWCYIKHRVYSNIRTIWWKILRKIK